MSEKDRKKVLAARDEMLQADKYPHIVFVSSRVLAKGENQYDVAGTLTIRFGNGRDQGRDDGAVPVVIIAA